MEDYFDRENHRLRYERLAITFEKLSESLGQIEIVDKEDIGFLKEMARKYHRKGVTLLDDPGAIGTVDLQDFQDYMT